ncbi:OPT oligopeptide transporter protein-domain-containing protein [Scheffersomyces amazonensis]|uniref:OPT oligopeptide transporter protein-domain-containing protein n=1 Tax=Scheffersomyces amazonensis TaxID=1078765 RepID=UPI00315DB8FA
MSDEKKEVTNITSITSVGSHYQELEDHEIDLAAVTSHPISIGDVGTTLTSDQKWFILNRLNFQGLVSLENIPIQASFMIEKIEGLTVEESVEIVKTTIHNHREDINYPSEDYDLLIKLIEYNDSHDGGDKYNTDFHEIVDWELQIKLEASLIAYHSPYPEVRAVTDPFDDPSVPVETVRVYIAGVIWTAIGAVINQLFAERQPGITLDASVVQVFLYPTGLILERILPKWKFKVWRYTIDLNPGPWTFKEQFLATLFYSVSGVSSYVSYNIHVQKLKFFYDNQWADFGYQTLLILSNNFLGFGFAGVMRKFAVYPVEAYWPTLLPTIALNRALMQPEKREKINGWSISKYRFFFYMFIFSFVYFWIPDFLFNAVSTFNWLTWISPNNFNLAMITGSFAGLGLNPIPTFDWNYLNFNYALTIPFYSQASQYVGSIITFFCIIGVYWSNYKWTAYLPINSSSLFTNTGEPYEVTSILNSKSLLDQSKYDVYGPPFYSAANLVLYGAFFALYPFAIVYEIGTKYESMYSAMKSFILGLRNYRKSTFEGFDDPHTRMMTAYKEVPDWAFLCVLIIALVLSIICVKIYPAETPVWGIFFALGINFVFLIPITAVYSRTGFGFGLNVLVELIVGYALPGNGLALNFIKAFGYNIDGQAQNYITDQKMAHYVKIPPRSLFRVQMLSVFIASFIQLGILNFCIDHIKGYCELDNPQKFTCPNSRVFYSASILWGVIGPKKVFDGLYPILRWTFLMGFLLAIPCLIFKRYGPRKITKYFEPTIIIGGMLIWAPYNLSYYTGGLYLSFFFMFYLKRKYQSWWTKYNYILTSGLSAGLAFSSIIMFFAVEYKTVYLSWWGNNVPYAGIDGGVGQQSLLDPTSVPGGYFGPRAGHFP